MKQFLKRYFAAGFISMAIAFLGILMHGNGWIITSDFHSAFEIVISLFAIIAGVSSIIYFIKTGIMFFLYSGLGFFVSGLKDLLHGFIGLLSPFAGSLFISSTITGRVGLSVLIILAVLNWEKNCNCDDKRSVVIKKSMFTSVGIMLIMFLTAFIMNNHSDFSHSSIFFFLKIFPIAILSFAFIAGIRKRTSDKDIFFRYTLLSVLFSIFSYVVFAFSIDYFDSLSLVAHIYKLLSYLMPLIGILALILWEHNELSIAKNALEDREAKQKALISSIPDIIITLDRSGYIVDMSNILPGLDPVECLGRNIGIFMEAPELKKIMKSIDNLLESGKKQVVESRISGPEGISHYLSRLSLLRRQGMETGVLLVLTDISRLKSVQKKLKDKEEFLNLARMVANDGIWDWDITTDEAVYDTRYYTMAGYEKDEFPGNYGEWAKRVHPEDFDNVQRTLEMTLSGVQDFHDIEFRYLCKNGDYMWIRGRGRVVVHDENGHPLRMIGTHSDISERKSADLELERTMKDLQHMNGLMEERELRILSMKQEVNDLLDELDRVKKYRSVELC